GLKAIGHESAGKLGEPAGWGGLASHTKWGVALGGIATVIGGVMLYMNHAAGAAGAADAATGSASTGGQAGAQPATS
ncbi:MAG: hypothetical protein ABI200_03785, partial [Gaiellales bacterium]